MQHPVRYMSAPLGATFVGLLALLAIASFKPQTCQAAESPSAAQLVFEVDFSKGLSQLPTGTKVLGGQWQEGWRVTDNNQRLVLDAGRQIKNGRLEVTITRKDVLADGMAFLRPAHYWRVMPVGVFELETLGKTTGSRGDSFRVQVGNHERPENLQGVVRANAKEEEGWRWMQGFGKWNDWKFDDRTPQTLTLEWHNGEGTVQDVTGKTLASSKTTHLDSFRYVALGGDNETAGSALGMRFLRARLFDYDQTQPPPPPPRRRVLFDLDLTKGETVLPTVAAVLGGEWDEGWRVTSNGQRLVMDAGYPIRNGSLELKMTRKRAVQTAQKINVFGLYEHPAIDQTEFPEGDIFYYRIGMTEIGQNWQGNVKAMGRGMAWEQRFGKFADWVMDDKTPVSIKMEWKDGNAFLTEIKGKVLTCPNDCGGNMDALRYVVLGGDRYDGGGSLIGLRFLSVKLTDYDVPEP